MNQILMKCKNVQSNPMWSGFDIYIQGPISGGTHWNAVLESFCGSCISVSYQ